MIRKKGSRIMAENYCHTVGCTQCKKTSSLPVKFTFTVEYVAGNNVPKDWTFSFCDLNCFFAWLSKIKKNGVPCQDCYGTGWWGGFKANGKCKTCKGKKFVRKTTMTGFAKVPKGMGKVPKTYTVDYGNMTSTSGPTISYDFNYKNIGSTTDN
jgi:hypothetical protein